MKLTTAQVAEKLGVTANTVRVWGEQGKFQRQAVGDGKVKQHYVYDSVSVNEFKKTRPPRNGKHFAPPAPPPAPFDRLVDDVMKSNRPPTTILGLFARMDAIEAKLDHLMRVWS